MAPPVSGAEYTMPIRDAAPHRHEAQPSGNTSRRSLRRTNTQIPHLQEESQPSPAAPLQTLRRAATQIPPRIIRPHRDNSARLNVALKIGLKNELLILRDQLDKLQDVLLDADDSMKRANRDLIRFMAQSIPLLHMYPDSRPADIIEPLIDARNRLEDDLEATQAKAKETRADVMEVVLLMLEKKDELRRSCYGIESAQFFAKMKPTEGQYLLSEGFPDLEEGDTSWMRR